MAEFMTNLTLTVDETLLRKARILALERGTSVNALVREFIAKTVLESTGTNDKGERFMALVERGKVSSLGFKMTRQEMYDSDPRMQKLLRIGGDSSDAGSAS